MSKLSTKNVTIVNNNSSKNGSGLREKRIRDKTICKKHQSAAKRSNLAPDSYMQHDQVAEKNVGMQA